MFCECELKLNIAVDLKMNIARSEAFSEVDFFRIMDEDEWYSTQSKGERKGRGGRSCILVYPLPPTPVQFSFLILLFSPQLLTEKASRRWNPTVFAAICIQCLITTKTKKIVLALLKPCVRTCHKFSILHLTELTQKHVTIRNWISVFFVL